MFPARSLRLTKESYLPNLGKLFFEVVLAPLLGMSHHGHKFVLLYFILKRVIGRILNIKSCVEYKKADAKEYIYVKF